MSRILVIEDQSDIRRLIRWSLEPDHHEIHEASNGPAGLSAAQLLRPDLVICDVMMPGGLTGFDVCTRIKADPQLADTVVLMLTARAQKSDRAAATAAGADAFMAKPFSPMELSETIARQLALAAARKKKTAQA